MTCPGVMGRATSPSMDTMSIAELSKFLLRHICAVLPATTVAGIPLVRGRNLLAGGGDGPG
jgi:hypothetical protein